MTVKTVSLAIIVTALTTPLAAQWLTQPTKGIPRTADGKPNLTAPAPRTPDGKPDLSGLWNKISPTYHQNIAADLKPGDVQPWANTLVEQRREDLGKDYMATLCLPLGPGYATSESRVHGGMTKIIQTPALIVFLYPELTYRQIFLDGRALETDPNPSWMGYSVGRWEGDTLVVESNGFNDRTWLDRDGHPHTEALRMTERYRRQDFGHLEIEVTLQDAAVYARPWTVALGAELTADTELLEWVCNENNKSLEHWVGKASDDQKSAVTVAPGILAKYVGVYKGIAAGRIRAIEITFAGEVLFIARDGAPPRPLVPNSETSFSAAGYAINFSRDDQGIPTHIIVSQASGDYLYDRQK